MTDYDLRTRKALRRVVLLEYGCARSAPAAAGPTAPTGRTAPTAARVCQR